jgi:hypothetical protein
MGAPQVPPLRFASVGMTSLRVARFYKVWSGGAEQQSLHCAPPDFLWNLVALLHFMRPSLRKGAYAALSSPAWQEIRVRSGRDDKFMGTLLFLYRLRSPRPTPEA